MKTMQELFNDMWNGLATQDFKQARIEGGGCRFRVGKRKCAIGHLIPDDQYNDEMEGRFGPYLLADLGIVDYDDGNMTKFLLTMQQAHDGVQSTGGLLFDYVRMNSKVMQERLAMVAQYYNLTVPETTNG